MSSVLYDAPGPRARRNSLIGSVVGGLALLGVLGFVVKKFADEGQFDSELWAPLLDPSNEVVGQVWDLLRAGFANTLTAAGIAIAFSLVLGVVLGVLRMSLPRVAAWPVVGFIELFRGLPVVLSIFFTANAFPEIGIKLPLLWYLVIGLTAYNSVIFAEILRAGVSSLPSGQREAGLAIGLTPLQTMSTIQLPQAFRVMLPAMISQMVVVLKDTTLAGVALAGYTEIMNQSKVVYQNLDNPIQVYFLVGLLFVLTNYLLGRLATFAEHKLSRRTAGGHIEPTALVTAGDAGTGAEQAAR